MKLVYCTEEGYHLALRFGMEVLGHDPGQDTPLRVFNAGRKVRRIESGEVEFQALDGIVTEVDVQGDVTCFMLRDDTGREREFDWDGDSVTFPIGRRVMVRWVAVAPEVSSSPPPSTSWRCGSTSRWPVVGTCCRGRPVG